MLSLVQDKIYKRRNTRFLESIPAAERLAVTLRFLATGDAQQSLSYSFRIGKITLSRIISETCTDILESLKDQYISCPKSSRECPPYLLFFSRYSLR